MEITMTELALFTWAMVSTLMWMQARSDMRIHKIFTHELLKRIGQGRIRVVNDGDGFQLKEMSHESN